MVPSLAAGDVAKKMGFQNPLQPSSKSVSSSASFKVCGSPTTNSIPSSICGSMSLTISLFFLFPRTGATVLLDHW